MNSAFAATACASLGGLPAQRAAACAGVPGQDVEQPADRGQPVLVRDLVPVMGGTVAQSLDVVQCLDHRIATDIRPAPADQVLQGTARRAARDVVMTPELLEQPFGDLPDPGDCVLRVPVAQRLDRPLEVQAEIPGDARVIVQLGLQPLQPGVQLGRHGTVPSTNAKVS